MANQIVRINGYDYELLQHLGSGAFGDVYQAKHSYGGLLGLFLSDNEYALKMIDITSPSDVCGVQTELNTLRSLSHENIVRFVDFGSFMKRNGQRCACFIMEMCHGGTLNDMLKKFLASVPTKQKWSLQIVTAIEYLHSQNIVHRDLKPDNILFSALGEVKVADFGLARPFHALQNPVGSGEQRYLQYMATFAGTKYFMAPEVFQEHYTKAADVFSVGLVLYIILRECYVTIGSKRFYVATINDQPPGLVMFVQKRDIRLSSSDQFVQAMTRYRPERRPKMAEILQQMKAAFLSDPNSCVLV